MALSVRRLGPDDEPILTRLVLENADFELEGHSETPQPLAPDAARRYLANPAVLYWVAFEDEILVGSLCCLVLPMDADSGSALLLHEIGMHHQWRRHGIGRVLVNAMETWMREQGVTEAWVFADNPGAVEFYHACGFKIEDEQPVYLTRSLGKDDA